MGVYSFSDVYVQIAGPGGSFPLGAGQGVAEEGIEIEMTEDKNSMMIGADGTGQHNLHAGESGTITLRLLKTSPTNSLLEKKYNYQKMSAANWGQDIISLHNPISGDQITAVQCAVTRFPRRGYAKEAAVMEWQWHAIRITTKLGANGPAFAVAS